MSTTRKYIKQKEYYSTKSKSTASTRSQTNPRYRNYQQVNYTAGDEEQFFQHISQKNGKTRDKVAVHEDNVWKDHFTASKLPGSVGPCAVSQNFRYHFHTVKKGIFVKIKDGKLEVFLPFSKNNFDNKWGDTLKMTTGEVNNLYRDCQTRSGRRFNPNRVNGNRRNWVGNNFLVRNEYPVIEGDSNVSCLKHMFTTLLKKRDIPDIELFLNRRDFPLLRDDGEHPYSHHVKVTTPTEVLPVFSMCSHEEFTDMAIPTWDDWSRIAYQNYSITFNSSYVNRLGKEYPDFKKETVWSSKKDFFVFRGASTGRGVTIETNPRLKLATLTDARLDAGITSWNLRPRVNIGVDGFTMKIISKEITDTIPLLPALTAEEQSEYKYLIHVPGHSCAFRLSLELAMNSVVLIVESEYSLWFFPHLVAGVHYVSVKADLSNLVEQMDWCCSNPEQCEQIAQNAKSFYQQYLSEASILDFLQKSIVDAKRVVGDYKYSVVSVGTIMHSLELKMINTLRESKVAEEMEEWVQVWKSKSTLVEKNPATNIVRKSVIKDKTAEFIHEAFIAHNVINKLPHADQFAKFNGIDETYTYWDYVPGEMLSEYLVSDRFSLTVFQDIVKQVMGLLHTSLEHSKLCHHDVFPWNIILKRESGRRAYHTQHGVWRSESKFKVVLLDFGKSNAVFNELCYDSCVKPFSSSTIQDTITFIISCTNILLTKQVSKPTLGVLFHMMGFLQKEVKYCPPFTTVNEMRRFTNSAKKYTEILYSDKGILEQLWPCDLIIALGVRVEDKRLRVVDNSVHLPLHSDIFTDPRKMLDVTKTLHHYPADYLKHTFLKLSKFIVRLNLKKVPDDKVYQELANYLNINRKE